MPEVSRSGLRGATVAVLSDVHGNGTALAAVLADVEREHEIAGIRSVNAGSVGMPYAEEPGAYWALLGPDVALRRTAYDLDEATRRYRATDDPLREEMVSLLASPPAPDELIARAESLEFSG